MGITFRTSTGRSSENPISLGILSIFDVSGRIFRRDLPKFNVSAPSEDMQSSFLEVGDCMRNAMSSIKLDCTAEKRLLALNERIAKAVEEFENEQQTKTDSPS